MRTSKGADVHTLDVYAYISNLIRATIDKGLPVFLKHMQTLYRLVISLRKTAARAISTAGPSIINIINALGASKFAKGDCGLCARCNHLYARFRPRRWWMS